MILRLPNETILSVLEFLASEGDINALSQANLRLYHLCNPYLYARNARQSASSALLWAATKGQERTVKLAIDAGAINPDSTETVSRSLRQAAKEGHAWLVKQLLLVEGVDVNLDRDVDEHWTYRGWTALTWAAQHGHDNVVQMLLNCDRVQVDPRTQARRRRTPLQWAACMGHDAVVKLLLDSGKVDVNAKDDRHQTSLSLAAECGHHRAVELLLNDEKVDANAGDMFQWTPLSKAAEEGHEAAVRVLLSSDKVDVNKENHCSRTPISLAAFAGKTKAVNLLLHRKNVKIDSRDRDGRTPLSWAACAGHRGVVELLLSSGAISVDSRDDRGKSPLIWAAENGHSETVELLLASGKVDANAKDRDGRTALALAAYKGHDKAVALLLDFPGVDANIKDKDGWTPLWLSVSARRHNTTKLLIECNRVDKHSKDNQDQTLLTWATQRLEGSIKLFLFSAQMDARKKYKGRRIPLTFASNDDTLIRLMLDCEEIDADPESRYPWLVGSWTSAKGLHRSIKLLTEHAGATKTNSGEKIKQATKSRGSFWRRLKVGRSTYIGAEEKTHTSSNG
ncbi:Ankyrin repeat domain-containing protein 50 [Cladobotryum mycophilum]|uniref:Ankyrin repeat domain-containing protein 50 n=1 Tax=Cladobotryum mycophilum TaxID=491253 RepID=A0ABR0STV7_9HYPO